jgi:glycosyltransferase involved in cell wall biosynthesis
MNPRHATAAAETVQPARSALGSSPAAATMTADRLRVLHVGKFYPPVPGGMERVLQLLCEHERESVDSQVLVVNTALRTAQEPWNGVPVTRVARVASIGSVGVCPTFPFELWRRPADVTVIHEPNPLALVCDFATARSGPVVVWYHSEVLRPAWKYRLMYRPFLTRVLRRAARIVVSSPKLVEHAQELQEYRAKCAVIPFGIELNRFVATEAIAERAKAIRARHAGRPLALFVGRLVPYKGVSVLIDAMRGVDVTALIVGAGPLGESLRAQARDANVDDRVVFAGEVDDDELMALFHACDMFVLPSVTHAEAFGMVQLEAMACGKPVICTDLPSGVPWVNQHLRTGLVVPPGDAAALHDAILRLGSDAALRTRLGAAARERVEREFTAERMAARTVALYREVLAEPMP